MTEKVTDPSRGGTVRLCVSGRVQGVGFRYFVLRAAREHDVRGWVRNLPDGRVEAHAECEDRQALESFLASVREGPHGARVDAVDAEELPASRQHERFEIRG